MHIVLASLPLQGHLPPIASLGQALRKQGHDVAICTADTEAAHKILVAHSPGGCSVQLVLLRDPACINFLFLEIVFWQLVNLLLRACTHRLPALEVSPPIH
jgi:hypothetical protein